VSIRALVVDDEPLARESVRRFLRAHPDVQIVGECGDGKSAVTAIRNHSPDLVFLDIQMAEMDGFAVLHNIGVERMPATIFVTAYDQYAVRAFEENVLDYLLKPFGRARFERALARVRERIARPGGRDTVERILRAVESIAGRHTCLNRVPVPENGRIVYVRVEDIEWIEAAGNYARLHVGARCHDVRETLTALEGKLDPNEFVRIHRSTIVNLRHVKEVHPWFHGYHLVVLANGQKLRMSRYQREVADRLGLNRPTERIPPARGSRTGG
jgi:two-component system LytT family response regulator